MADFSNTTSPRGGYGFLIGAIVFAIVLLYIVIAADSGTTDIDPATLTAPIADEPLAPAATE
jgi:hypothetical protein